ncbi:MAG: hypothetical protein ACI4DP_00825 [Candidatus Ornithomonoglobus sp.]
MEYFVNEVQYMKDASRTAGQKAREDINSIFREEKVKELELLAELNKGKNFVKSFIMSIRVAVEWKKRLDVLKSGDVLYVQFPVFNKLSFLYKHLVTLKKRGVKTVLIIHDLESFRMPKKDIKANVDKQQQRNEELKILLLCDKIIAHNAKMAEVIKQLGVDGDKLVELGIFDYLIPEADKRGFDASMRGIGLPVIIAGALRRHKAGYAYDLPEGVDFSLYGVGYAGEEKANVLYNGSFPPDELPFSLKGSFGLVWDGSSADTCAGINGEYLRINNPHKTSLYLASELPVIIWSKAALADFITENKCGFAVDSLDQIPKKINGISDEEYNAMIENTKHIAKALRSGRYTKAALKRCRS